MPGCSRILVPVDLADFSPRVVPWVKSVAEKYGAEVHLLYVEPSLREHTAGRVPDISVTRKFEAEAFAEAKQQLREIAEKHLGDCPVVKTGVVAGHAGHEIARYVRKERIDLVIIGTHGRKAIGHLVFGSVAEEVLKTSPVPVLALKPFRASSPQTFGISTEADPSLDEELSQYQS